MICSICQADFNPVTRDNYLELNSQYILTNFCIDCILAELYAKQLNIYPDLKEAAKARIIAKATFDKARENFENINKEYHAVGYERNLIIHYKEKHEAALASKQAELTKKQASKKKASKKKQTSIDTKAIQAMLANLTPEQQAAVMTNFMKSQISQTTTNNGS